MRIAKFNEGLTDNTITVEEELMIRDIFQDLDDNWDLLNIKPSLHGGPRNNKFINYLFFGPYSKSGKERSNDTIYLPKGMVTNFNIDGDFLGIYFDLTGPNDFYTIRSKFLDDVEIMSNRIEAMTYFKCEIGFDRYNRNKFILFITK